MPHDAKYTCCVFSSARRVYLGEGARHGVEACAHWEEGIGVLARCGGDRGRHVHAHTLDTVLSQPTLQPNLVCPLLVCAGPVHPTTSDPFADSSLACPGTGIAARPPHSPTVSRLQAMPLAYESKKVSSTLPRRPSSGSTYLREGGAHVCVPCVRACRPPRPPLHVGLDAHRASLGAGPLCGQRLQRPRAGAVEVIRVGAQFVHHLEGVTFMIS